MLTQSKLCRRLCALATVLASLGATQVHANPVAAAVASHIQASASCNPLVGFDPRQFSNPTTVSNKFFPLTPGTQLFLSGTINVGGVSQVHRIIFTVSDVTKVINGVRTLVMWDRDINDGKLAERELAFFAQDNEGNVWNLGEYPEEFEGGQFAGAPSTWIGGQLGTEAGIHMPANPQVSKVFYLQASAPSVQFLDCGRISQKGLSMCVPASCYDNVLVTEEKSPLVPHSGVQLKYHVPNIGIVQVGAAGDPEAEILALTKIKHLGADEMERVRSRVCKLDHRGYRFSEVYRATGRAERNGHPCNETELTEEESKQFILADAAEN